MFEKRYEVLSAALEGLNPGDQVKQGDSSLNLEALAQGGHLKELEQEKEACPQCEAEGLKRPPKFASYEELQEHYADKHAGLVAPSGEEG